MCSVQLYIYNSFLQIMIFILLFLTTGPMEDNMAAYVRGSKQGKRRGESWKKYYKRKTRQDFPETCSMEGCENVCELGAHVRIKERPEVFILPSCMPCYRNRNGYFGYNGLQNWSPVKEGRTLVGVGYSRR